MAEKAHRESPAKEARAATRASETEQGDLPTEKPVPSTPVKRTSQYVVTVDNETGVASKIEKLDEATGDRQELTRDEYMQVAMYASPLSAPLFTGLSGSAPASAAENESLVQAYYRGVAAYLNALTSPK